MREILFRGKAIDFNNEKTKFVYGQYVQNRNGYFIYTDTWENGIKKYQIIIETVGQYTGLTDKNGTKIFEGDVIKCVALSNDHSQKGTKAILVVENYMGNTCLRLDGKYLTGVTLYTISVDHTIEVIGNIYDNPELLEGK